MIQFCIIHHILAARKLAQKSREKLQEQKSRKDMPRMCLLVVAIVIVLKHMYACRWLKEIFAMCLEYLAAGSEMFSLLRFVLSSLGKCAYMPNASDDCE